MKMKLIGNKKSIFDTEKASFYPLIELIVKNIDQQGLEPTPQIKCMLRD